MTPDPNDTTLDAVLGGILQLRQPRDGYRFSVDSILLAKFARARTRDRVLDLGAGCGVISAIIAMLDHPREVVALELQRELAELCASNAKLNSLDNMHSVCADLRARRIAQIASASFDLIVANPPFHAAMAGRESPNSSRKIARGGGGAALHDFIRAARRFVRPRGRVAFVSSAYRVAELVAAMRAENLEPKRLRFVHPRKELRATSVLVDARAGGGVETIVEPPLILYDTPGIYRAEARELIGSSSRPLRAQRSNRNPV